MSDGASRLLTLSVLGSAFHGKTVDVAAVDEVLIGSDPGCSLHIEHPGVSPIHARLWVEEAGATVYDTKSPTGVFVNFDRVEGQALLREGDMIWLGPPQEPGSVLIQCTFGVLHARAAPLVFEAADLVGDEPAMSPPPEAPAAPFVVEESAEIVELAEIEAPPPAGPPALGFDDFLAPDAQTPEAPAAEADFVVAGFEVELPEAAPAVAMRAPAAAPVAGPAPEDPFFIGDAAAPPPSPPAAQAEDAFFIAEDLAGEAPPHAAAPPTPAVEPEPVSFAADEFFPVPF